MLGFNTAAKSRHTDGPHPYQLALCCKRNLSTSLKLYGVDSCFRTRDLIDAVACLWNVEGVMHVVCEREHVKEKQTRQVRGLFETP